MAIPDSDNPTVTNTQNSVSKEFLMTISSDRIVTDDKHFTINDLNLGDSYKPLNVYFQNANGEMIQRNYRKGERRNSNQTLPRLAFQIFENQIAALSQDEKESFPICRYALHSTVICGIYPSVDEYRKHRKTFEHCIYNCDNGKQFVIYCWNIFSTLQFIQECLKRFGKPGDQFILKYVEKGEMEMTENESHISEDLAQQAGTYKNPYSSMLIESKNIIFHGAPGTGKSYLAKEIAADIVSNGRVSSYTQLTTEEKAQIEFVQFHPSYDYSDFVEGLRPKVNADGSMRFDRQDGIFKKFVDNACKNLENSLKSSETIEKELSVQEAMTAFFANIEPGVNTFRTINGSEFIITSVDDDHINISIPGNATFNKICLNIAEVQQMLESDKEFEKIKDITAFFGKTFATQAYSYDFAIYKAIKAQTKTSSRTKATPETLKNYVFIIDEINRGEISKIFGELFFAIDPGYRGKIGEISTQYAYLHDDPSKKFYIPENVYVIGTMNDIDRSVDSFDFAMRRRFRFVNLKANENLKMLDCLDNDTRTEAIRRMTALNKAIVDVEDLNDNYQIGAAYFLKLKTLNFDQLWTDYLEPLLHEYVQGIYGAAEYMSTFASAYGYKKSTEGDRNGTDQS